jgi:hypothetical protein
MIKAEDLKDYCCRFCNGKFEHHPDPDDKNKIQTFVSPNANICGCGRSGELFNVIKNHIFNLYYNEQFTIEYVIYNLHPKECSVTIVRNKDSHYYFGSTDDYAEIPEQLIRFDSVEELFSMVDCFIGTLGFR